MTKAQMQQIIDQQAAQIANMQGQQEITINKDQKITELEARLEKAKVCYRELRRKSNVDHDQNVAQIQSLTGRLDAAAHHYRAMRDERDQLLELINN